MIHKNDFAVTPPMGWNSYDYYNMAATEEDIRKNADYMAEHLKEFGYEYVVVDIQWYAKHINDRDMYAQYRQFCEVEMDEYSRLLPDPERFPSSVNGQGFKPLADYIHSKGLKFGIHIMRGIHRYAAATHMKVLGTDLRADQIAHPFSICLWNGDMYGVRDIEAGQAYYDSIIALYAEWGVDYIKCDDICDSRIAHEGPASTWHEIEMLHNAILKAGRPIILSLSPGPAFIEKAWFYEKYANMWRITDDFWDDYSLLINMFWRCELWQNHVSPGNFPDCDMLPLGLIGGKFGNERHTNFTYDEAKTMMTLWCFFRAPLMIGAELTKLDPESYKLLTNAKLLACLKDTAKGTQIYRCDSGACWKNVDSETGEVRVALFNFTEEEKEMTVSAYDFEEDLGKYSSVEEIWGDGEGRIGADMISAKVPKHGVRAFVLK